MILDTLANADRYIALNPHFAAAFNFLKQAKLAELPEGKHELDGTDVYAIIAHENGRKAEDAELEGHRKYIDIQLVLSGDESMGWSPRAGLINSQPYDAERDLEFFKGTSESMVRVPPASFAIFFPEDAHLPLVGNDPIHKVIVKVPTK